MKKRLLSNPYIIFSPFFIFYCFYVVKNKLPKLYGDEIRYVDFAHNLIHGYYSPKPPHINLWNGPGYPLVITPFIALKVPVLYITMLNALFLYMAVVFLYKAITLVANYKIALLFCLLMAIYPNAHAILPILYTEALTIFLISALILSVTLYYHLNKTSYLLISGVVLGAIVLTKIIFGYVVIVCLAAGLLSLLFKEHRETFKGPVKIIAIGFLVAAPYLMYTYQLTGRLMYWGNSGGMSLYWMSTPYANEYGDWKIPSLSNRQYPASFRSPEVTAILRKNHAPEIKAILKHSEMVQDDLFKQAAIRNIKQHPLKFIQNYYYNVSRMLFNFPYSYSFQNAAIVKNIFIGSGLFWASVIALVITVLNWSQVIHPIRFLLFLTGIYLLASAALSSYPRQLDVMVPVFFFWFGFLAGKLKRIELKFKVAES